MNNEPVAWQGLTAEEISTIPNDEFRLQKVEKILKEKNTHPAKTLSHKDIIQTAEPLRIFGWLNEDVLIEFAVAILKKASEK